MRVLALLGVLTLHLVFCIPSAEASPNQAELRPVPLLLERFETVSYADGALFESIRTRTQTSEMRGLLLRPFMYGIVVLESLGKETNADLFQSTRAVLVGAKNFALPKGFGQVRADRCYVIVLRDGNSFDIRRYFPQSGLGHDQQRQVWNWTPSMGEFGEEDRRPSSLYATQVGTTYVVISNVLAELVAVADNLESGPNATARRPGVQDWEALRASKVWTYRKYRHDGVINRQAAGMTDVPRSAEALAFIVDLNKEDAVLRLYMASNDLRSAAMVGTRALLPPWKPRSPGVFETTLRLAGDQSVSPDTLVGIMWLLGFAVAV